MTQVDIQVDGSRVTITVGGSAPRLASGAAAGAQNSSGKGGSLPDVEKIEPGSGGPGGGCVVIGPVVFQGSSRQPARTASGKGGSLPDAEKIEPGSGGPGGGGCVVIGPIVVCGGGGARPTISQTDVDGATYVLKHGNVDQNKRDANQQQRDANQQQQDANQQQQDANQQQQDANQDQQAADAAQADANVQQNAADNPRDAGKKK